MISDGHTSNARLGPLGPLARLSGRAAAITLRPAAEVAALSLRSVGGVAALAAQAGRGLERRAVQRVLDSPEVERLPSAAMDSARTQAAIKSALASDGARQLVATLFESGLFDEIVDQLLASDGLWRLVDELAGSQAVMDAVAQQGLGFADQVGDVARARSRIADDWLERRARRLTSWRSKSREPDGSEPGRSGP